METENKRERSGKTAAILLSFFMAFSILVGKSFVLYDDFSMLFEKKAWFMAWGWIIIYTIIIYACIRACARLVKEKCICAEETACRFDRFELLIAAACMVLCYLPFYVTYYPGAINSDTLHQMASYCGYIPNTNHYPIFSTFLIGSCLKIGTSMQSENLGAFLYALLQGIALIAAFVYTIRVMKLWQIRRSVRAAAMLFYSLTPLWGGYAQFLIKDTIYTAAVVWFVTLAFRMLYDKREGCLKPLRVVVLVLSAMMVILLRNNGIYVVAPTLLMLGCWNRKHFARGSRGRWLVFIPLFAVIILYEIWVKIYLPMGGYPQVSMRETLSVPFQQTARYVRDYGDEVTEEERAVIDQVLDYSVLAENYVSWGADPVKNTYRELPRRSDLWPYVKVWLKMFLKHPGTYFEATVGNSYYYYSMGVKGSLEPVFVTFIAKNEHRDFFDLDMVQDHDLRDSVWEFADGFEDFPVLGYLHCEGFYTYLMLGMIAVCALCRKGKLALLWIPSILCVLICVASPVNGSMRYFLPVIGLTPICLSFTWKLLQEQSEEKSGK